MISLFLLLSSWVSAQAEEFVPRSPHSVSLDYSVRDRDQKEWTLGGSFALKSGDRISVQGFRTAVDQQLQTTQDMRGGELRYDSSPLRKWEFGVGVRGSQDHATSESQGAEIVLGWNPDIFHFAAILDTETNVLKIDLLNTELNFEYKGTSLGLEANAFLSELWSFGLTFKKYSYNFKKEDLADHLLFFLARPSALQQVLNLPYTDAGLRLRRLDLFINRFDVDVGLNREATYIVDQKSWITNLGLSYGLSRFWDVHLRFSYQKYDEVNIVTNTSTSQAVALGFTYFWFP